MKPETSSSGGFVTSFIDVCHCGRTPIVEDGSATPVFLCAKCHRTIAAQARRGSLTQWIFRFDTCKCDEPEPVFRPAPVPDVEVETIPALDEVDEISLTADQFPVERYRPIRELGQGSSGAVYLAVDRLLDIRVAVKVLNRLTAEQLLSFQDEARLTSKLDHTNIIGILDFGPTSSGRPYMVLEFCERVRSLADAIEAQGSLSLNAAVELFLQVCDALEYAHRMPVYHCDLKPSNILITDADKTEVTVKLIDFGVAKAQSDAKESSRQTTIVGTVGYMAPELAAGARYDASCDVYSLGCVMFEALTATLPFSADSPLEMLSKHAMQEPPALNAVSRKKYPQALEKLVSVCLSKDPAQRPSTEKIKQQLRRIAVEHNQEQKSDSIPVQEEAPSLNLQNWRPQSQRRISNTYVFAGVLAVAACVSVPLIISMQSPAPVEPAKSVQFSETPRESKVLAEQLYGSELSLQDRLVESLDSGDAGQITTLRITGCTIKDPRVLRAVSSFPKLKNIYIQKTKGLNSDAIEQLSLGLQKNVSNETVVRAANRLAKPLLIDFTDSDIEAPSLSSLQKVPSIVSLSLAGTSVDDSLCEYVSSYEFLRAIDLSRTGISDEAVRILTGLKPLVLLRVYDCPRLKKISGTFVSGNTTVRTEKPNTPVDDEMSIYYEAAQADNTFAQCGLGSFYYLGRGVDRDFDEALKWYQKAALAGSPGGMFSVATFYKLGLIGKKRDEKEALKWFIKADAAGESKAAFAIAQIYEIGVDGHVDYASALKWYRKAAAQGRPDAVSKIGEFYLYGQSVPTNYREANKWYQKAADANYPHAIYALGESYLTGKGFPQSNKKALEYYRRAAELGYGEAMSSIGCLYLQGQGVPVDYTRAMHWFQLGAQQDSASAKTNIGFLYDRGLGVKQDPMEAIKWYRAGARGGAAEAQLAIGDCYRDGRGVQRDPDLARKYYREAAQNGSDEAKQRLGQ